MGVDPVGISGIFSPISILETSKQKDRCTLIRPSMESYVWNYWQLALQASIMSKQNKHFMTRIVIFGLTNIEGKRGDLGLQIGLKINL